MASTLKKLRKLQRDPKLFVRDMMFKKLGASPGNAGRVSGGSLEFTPSDYEIIDGLAVLNKPELVSELRRIKDSGTNSGLTLTWRR